eukprot:Filipodium_phascolosomae@DN4553_c0_g1_i1.p1
MKTLIHHTQKIPAVGLTFHLPHVLPQPHSNILLTGNQENPIQTHSLFLSDTVTQSRLFSITKGVVASEALRDVLRVVESDSDNGINIAQDGDSWIMRPRKYAKLGKSRNQQRAGHSFKWFRKFCRRNGD